MPRPDERPDDGLIHAWLDGELGAEEAARVERLVAEDAEWAAAAAEARGLMAASTRILGALDVVAGDVIPRGGSAAGTFAPTSQRTRWAVPAWMRVAAGVVLVAGIGYLGIDRSGTTAVDQANGARATVAAKQSEPELAASDAMVASAPVASAPIAQPPIIPAPVAPPVTAPAEARRAEASNVAPMSVPAPAATSALAEPQVARTDLSGVSAGAPGVGSAERDAREQTSQRVLASPPKALARTIVDSPNPTGAAMADAFAARAVAPTSVTGCWRVRTTAAVDSIQTSLRIVRAVGDSLVLALTPAGAEARVVRESDMALRGSARGVSGPSATFRAERMACIP